VRAASPSVRPHRERFPSGPHRIYHPEDIIVSLLLFRSVLTLCKRVTFDDDGDKELSNHDGTNEYEAKKVNGSRWARIGLWAHIFLGGVHRMDHDLCPGIEGGDLIYHDRIRYVLRSAG